MAQADYRIQRRQECHNPIERVFGVLEKYWNGDPLRTVEKAMGVAEGMTYKGAHSVARLVTQTYTTGIKLSNKLRRHYEQALGRLPELRKWFVTIDPGKARMACALAKK